MFKGMKGAAFGFMFGAMAVAAAVPAHAASADSGFTGPSFVTLTLGGQAFYGAVSMVESVGSSSVSGSGASTSGYNVGTIGGTNYAAIASFYLAQPYGGTYSNASLSFLTSSVSGSPTITASLLPASTTPYTTYAQAMSGTAIGSTTLSPSTTLGSQSIGLGSNFTSSLGSSYQLVQVALTSGGGNVGAGTPGPIAGAGLPFLAVAGAAWFRRRRAAAKDLGGPLALAA